jgi:two-component system, LytTR family, sensor kinase
MRETGSGPVAERNHKDAGTRSFPAALGTGTSAIKARSDLALLSAFWIYVTLTNVLWGSSMQASLASIGVNHVFDAWNTRVVQHLILYPALICGMWVSRRIGWQPLWRAAALQLLCGVAFSALGNPAMDVAEALVGVQAWHQIRIPGLLVIGEKYPGQQAFLWVASAASFLIDYAFCLALLVGFEFYRRYRDSQLRAEALERSLSAAHLEALRMQLSPHTFFNLLHTIRGHVIWDPAVAQAMIVQLGDLMRRALQAGEHELSHLDDELTFVRLYLQLQQHRFTDRLIVVVPDSKTSPAVMVPSLILQPLVENAVVHGLADPQSAVTIRVQVLAAGETLVLRVLNSLPADGTVAATAPSGIGLKNVRERLTIQFGARAAFHAGPGPDNDWVAEIRLPMLHAGVGHS